MDEEVIDIRRSAAPHTHNKAAAAQGLPLWFKLLLWITAFLVIRHYYHKLVNKLRESQTMKHRRERMAQKRFLRKTHGPAKSPPAFLRRSTLEHISRPPISLEGDVPSRPSSPLRKEILQAPQSTVAADDYSYPARSLHASYGKLQATPLRRPTSFNSPLGLRKSSSQDNSPPPQKVRRASIKSETVTWQPSKVDPEESAEERRMAYIKRRPQVFGDVLDIPKNSTRKRASSAISTATGDGETTYRRKAAKQTADDLAPIRHKGKGKRIRDDIQSTDGTSDTGEESDRHKDKRGKAKNSDSSSVLSGSENEEDDRMDTDSNSSISESETIQDSPKDEDIEMPDLGAKKPGDTWENANGEQFRMKEDGETQKLVSVREERFKYRMPADSTHPDKDVTELYYVDRWVSRKEFEHLKDEKRLEGQDDAKEESMTPEPVVAQELEKRRETSHYYIRGSGVSLHTTPKIVKISTSRSRPSTPDISLNTSTMSLPRSFSLPNGRMRISSSRGVDTPNRIASVSMCGSPAKVSPRIVIIKEAPTTITSKPAPITSIFVPPKTETVSTSSLSAPLSKATEAKPATAATSKTNPPTFEFAPKSAESKTRQPEISAAPSFSFNDPSSTISKSTPTLNTSSTLPEPAKAITTTSASLPSVASTSLQQSASSAPLFSFAPTSSTSSTEDSRGKATTPTPFTFGAPTSVPTASVSSHTSSQARPTLTSQAPVTSTSGTLASSDQRTSGLVLPAPAKPATSSTPSFSFGNSSKTSNVQPHSSASSTPFFLGSSAPPTAAPLLGTPAAMTQSAPSFSFGASTALSTDANPSFSFGTVPATTEKKSPATFNFGAPATDIKPSAPSFSFGTPQQHADSTSKPTYNFNFNAK